MGNNFRGPEMSLGFHSVDNGSCGVEIPEYSLVEWLRSQVLPGQIALSKPDGHLSVCLWKNLHAVPPPGTGSLLWLQLLLEGPSIPCPRDGHCGSSFH